MTNVLPHSKNVAPGMAIANSKGVPGTLGCIAWNKRHERWVGLSCGHVLMGKNAGMGDEIWKVEYAAGGKFKCFRVGCSISSRIGLVNINSAYSFADCAICCFDDQVRVNHFFNGFDCRVRGSATAAIGDRVIKIGAITGLTKGVVTEIAYPDHAYIDGRSYEAPNQLLISPENPDNIFSAPGDSGSVILNDKNEVIGLLWGSTANGQGVASPIAPIMNTLGIQIVEKDLNFFERISHNFKKLNGTINK